MLQIVQWIIDALGFLLQSLLSMLPDSPFLWDVPEWLKPVTYFIPFGSMLSLLFYYCSAVIVWYSIRTLFRVVKAIS